MGMVIRSNQMALNTNNALSNASKSLGTSMEKLATGFKINKAADDASGLSISEKMKAQIKALDTASANCEDGANMIQTAEGYMSETHDILNRMVELSEKSANGVLDDTDRDALQDEMDQLCAEVDRMATTANFNGRKLMDGSLGSTDNLTLTVAADTTGAQTIQYTAPTPTVTAPITYAGGATAPTGLTSGNDDEKAAVLAEINKVAANKAQADAAGEGATDVTVYFKKAGTSAADADVTTADKSGDTTNYASLTVSVTGTAGAAVKPGIMLQIGESSTSADRLNVSINSFHTDSLLGGLAGFKNTTNDTSETGATASVKLRGNYKDGNSTATPAGTVDTDYDLTTAGVATYKKAVSIDITDKESASAAADALRHVSNYVSDERGKLGAQQNRLEHTVNNLTTASENTSAANSRIRDTDMAKQMTEYTKTNVIAQAAQAMLAQANSQPQSVLQLLQ